MSTLRHPRRAWRDFQGVLNESLFLYMKFQANKYLRNWGCCEVLRSIGDDLLILWFTCWRFMGYCAAMFFFCLCEFEFSLYWAFYVHDSHVLVCFYLSIHILILLYAATSLVTWFPGFVVLPFLPLQLHCSIVVCAVFAYTSYFCYPCL